MIVGLGRGIRKHEHSRYEKPQGNISYNLVICLELDSFLPSCGFRLSRATVSMLHVVAVSLAKASPVSPIPLFIAASTSNQSRVRSIMQDTFLKQGYGCLVGNGGLNPDRHPSRTSRE